jgi:DNA invertase Pin-like site-specific DNA recombinase
MTSLVLRCAIYTRKSCEEGLEQAFNSLDAQREACESYIASQRHEGWRVLPELYDDGGYSGGNLERPAMKRLLADIDAGRVNVAVVYKVDRLTRSLADFAKIVERFDARGVSFVSVTQQFNTTSSMGRLTLNVLLSFAQFEREVTGERIRDKIAASKQKGLWMGGVPPMGYRVQDRALVVDEEGADRIRHIYARYLVLGNVRELKRELDQADIHTPRRTSAVGKEHGGRPFCRGHLHRILSDPVYIGVTKHHGQRYAGQHPSILDQETWDQVQALIVANRQGEKTRRMSPSVSLLAGKVFDENGARLVPSHSQKRAKRYRYYISLSLKTDFKHEHPDGFRIPAQELDNLVVDALCGWLDNHPALISALNPDAHEVEAVLTRAGQFKDSLDRASGTDTVWATLCVLLERVVVMSDSVIIVIRLDAFIDGDRSGDSKSKEHLLRIAAKVTRCGRSVRMLVPGDAGVQLRPPDAGLIENIADGYAWLEMLTSGKIRSLGELANQEGVGGAYLIRSLYRALLAPDIVRAIMDGSQPPHLNLNFIKQHSPLPIDWEEQRALLGFPAAQ